MATIINYETAKLAKTKGYNHYCIMTYQDEELTISSCYDLTNLVNEEVYTPTQSELQKWLRDNFQIHIEIYVNASGWGYIFTKLNGTVLKEIEDDCFFENYEAALELALIECLNLI